MMGLVHLGQGAILTPLILLLFPVIGFVLKRPYWGAMTKHAGQYTTLLLCLAMGVLILGYGISDFEIENVYQNSHSMKPLLYKLTGSWGNHEGSMLLFTLILSLVYFFAIRSCRIAAVALIFQHIIWLILIYLAVFSSPFIQLLPPPEEGVGLNPLLQDIGLAIHPPILYIGYALLAVPFSYALYGLFSSQVEIKKLARLIHHYALLAWIFLTIGIALGSWWAYRELGWGGFWFWDPVENVSLLPWLCATALLHSARVTAVRGTYAYWTFILSVLSFLLCLFGFFLVRSGLLNSVHSFALSPQRGLAILAICGWLMLVVFLACLRFISKVIGGGGHAGAAPSRELLIGYNNIIMVIAIFVVALGLFYPLATELLSQQAVSVGPVYYNLMMAGLSIALLPMMALAHHSRWVGGLKRRRWSLGIFCCMGVFFAAIFYGLTKAVLSSVVAGLAMAMLLQTIIIFVKKWRNQAGSNAPTLKMAAITLGHVGFGILLIAIVANAAFSLKQEQVMQVGDVRDFQELSLKLEAIKYLQKDNYIARQAVFMLEGSQAGAVELTPELRRYFPEGEATTEAALVYGLWRDYYLAIGQDSTGEGLSVRFYVRVAVAWIWLSAALMALAGVVALFAKRRGADGALD